MKNDDEMYQSLLSRYEAYQEEKIQRKRIVRRIVPIAACFCLSVALGCSYWFHFRNIPTVPALPETTTEPTTEPTTIVVPETEITSEAEATEPSAETQPASSAETGSQLTDPTEPTVPSPTTPPEPTDPAQPKQTQTATAPPKETTPKTTEQVAPTESAPTEPPPTEPFTEELTDGLVVEYLTEALTDGFVVEYLEGCKRIVCTETMPEMSGTLRQYEFITEPFYLVSVNGNDLSENDRVNKYLVRSVMESPRPPEFTITQREFEDFSLTVSADAEISSNIALSERRGFYIIEGNTCTLYWFEDNECFCVSGNTNDLQHMLSIARSFVPADQSEMR